MKTILRSLTLGFIIIVASACSKNDEDVATLLPQKTFNLGITTDNMYPNWPDTWRAGLGDNEWYN